MSVQPRRADLTAPTTDTVRLEGVRFGYADGPDVLRDVNLILPAGSFHFLTGPSGSGKSTLLKLLTLTKRPTAGVLELFGEDVGAAPRAALPALRRRIGLVSRDFALLDHLSAFDNVALPLRLSGEKPETWTGNVEEMLDWVGLGERRDDRPAALSGGERQRLAVARAVVNQPRLILADEPTGSVDAAEGDRLLKLFRSLNRLGATVLIASHDERVAADSGATVLRLDGGRLRGASA